MKIEQPGAHLDHMIRQTRMHHMQLSAMADMKANILLTVSTVVLTLSLRLVSDPALKWPILCLQGFCLLTIILATYVVMPHIPIALRTKTTPDVKSPGFNLLFFGHFVGLDYETFEAKMEEIMQTPGATYEAQTREIFQLGNFLARTKYRHLRFAYFTLIAGFVTSGIVHLFQMSWN
ncbi:MAG: Pycsar system effector family protein [Planctomycetota bacterium]|jgi:hypothetical protein